MIPKSLGRNVAPRTRSSSTVAADSDLAALGRSGMIAFLHSCGARKDFEEGKRAHAFLERHTSAAFFMNLVVEMYGKCGRIEDARRAFASIQASNVYSWTAIISALAQNGHPRDAIQMFARMELEGARPDKVLLNKIVAACASTSALPEGRKIHERARAMGVLDPFLQSSLINLYGNCGRIDLAKSVFDSLAGINVVCWTAMIKALSRNGLFPAAVDLFWEWIAKGCKPDVVTFVSAVDSCSGLRDPRQSDAIYERIVEERLETNEILASAVVTMFVRSGAVDKARAIFERMELKSVVPWTAMISAYAAIGRPREAFRLFQRMDTEGVASNEITFLGLLEGFACRASLRLGRLIHGLLAEDGQIDAKVSNALLDMYARCGSVEDSKSLFDEIRFKTIVTWTAMLAAYAQNGYVKEALEVSQEMDQAGMSKNEVTFVTILSACKNGGLLEEGIRYLACMSSDHGITPSAMHYSCVIDLLGKAGKLEEAEKLIDDLVEHPDVAVWRTLLGSCRIHRDESRAVRAGTELKRLQPSSSAPYVVLSSIGEENGH